MKRLGGMVGGDDMEALGRRVRLMRQARGFSLRALAKAAGVSVGTLQKMEDGRCSPSVSTLKSVLQALGTTLGEFFAGEDAGGGERFVFRPGEQIELSTQRGVSFLGLPPAGGDWKLQILRETYAPGTGTGPGMLEHAGEDAGFCLAGTMELIVGGCRLVLGPGDAFRYPSRLPHRWRNIGRTRAELVTACTPPTF